MGAESGHLEASETGETLKIQCILLIGSTLIGAILYIFLNRLMKNKLETRWDLKVLWGLLGRPIGAPW